LRTSTYAALEEMPLTIPAEGSWEWTIDVAAGASAHALSEHLT